MALKRSRKKFYKAEKAWVLFEIGSAKAYNRRSVTVLMCDGKKAQYENTISSAMPSYDLSYYDDVVEFFREDD